MRKLFLFATAIIAVCSVANAQTVNPETPSASGSFWEKAFAKSPKYFGTISVSYNPMKLKETKIYSAEVSMTGFSLNWTNANKVCKKIPLYVDYGAGVQYSFRTGGGGSNPKDPAMYGEMKLLSVKVPVSALFRLDIPNSKIAIAPYVGLDALCYVFGKEYDDNLFEYGYNRFNLDWHIGARFIFNHFFFAAAYEGPIIGLYNKNNTKLGIHQANLSVGFTW